MERLTRREKAVLSHGEEVVICKHDEKDCNDSCMKIRACKWYEKAMEKLKAYEDAEEQGLLLRLPCKVGDTVWFVGEKYVNDYEVRNIVLNETGIAYIKMAKKIDGEDYWLSCYYEDFGVRAFLSEAEAEQALADKGV